MVTRCPRSSSCRAVAAPMPLPPPVIRVTGESVMGTPWKHVGKSVKRVLNSRTSDGGDSINSSALYVTPDACGAAASAGGQERAAPRQAPAERPHAGTYTPHMLPEPSPAP